MDPIAALRLGDVHRGVGLGQQVVTGQDGFSSPDMISDSNTYRNSHDSIQDRNGYPLDAVTDLLGYPLDAFRLGVHEENDELVAPETGRHIRRPDTVSDGHRHSLQHIVAGLVAVAVVGLLEAVQVEKEHREYLTRAVGSRDLLTETVL